MANVTFENLTKIYPNGFSSVKGINLSIESGEFVTFHGPHGCGKSTILRMIGGLDEITSGYIYFDDLLLNGLSPSIRPLAMAFQNYAIYTHLNVFENIALGLRIRNRPRAEIDKRVNKAAHFMGIGHLLTKKIRSISDGDIQQVAFCRAIVCGPRVLLVDEDFAHQDGNRRKEMIRDLIKINKELHVTILYVTNDYHEAISVGDKVVFMDEGHITHVEPIKHFL